MRDNPGRRWVDGLPDVQLQKNGCYHEGIKRPPYTALFGSTLKMGLNTSILPMEVYQNLQTEEELAAALGQFTEQMETEVIIIVINLDVRVSSLVLLLIRIRLRP